ncbi:MAG TPA: hypothetical protein VFK28_07900 [Sphingomicrobium sp.]|nr:hypothetical protein [Sphingomicrobium sp.]
MNRTVVMTALFPLLAACQGSPDPTAQGNAENAPAPAAPMSPAAPSPAPAPTAPQPPAPGTPGGLPDDKTPLSEPDGPINPKSAEAAGQVVQHYGALIEQGRWTESWKLWSNPDAAKQFDRNWRNDSEVHMEIGKPGDTEGAAGSIYTTVPAIFYGKTKTGGSFRREAKVILRRVNDVPGSTEAQRRWHIERVEWKAAA